jgi:hypothetical protein
VFEDAVRVTVTADRTPEVVRPVGIGGLRRLLGLVVGPGKVAVEEPGKELVSKDRFHRRTADPELGPVAVDKVWMSPPACCSAKLPTSSALPSRTRFSSAFGEATLPAML